MIRTVTGDVDSIRGRILPHEHLQIDLSAQKGPANKIGEHEIDAVVEDLRTAKEYRARRDHRPERAVVGSRSGGACGASASRRASQ